jgi:uroporphyrinogen-III synthase|tara:strand:+ start:442 stop:1248 length:807 start_codon:yes stop_codon:yes gene_type:complete
VANLSRLQALLIRAIQPNDPKEDIFIGQLRSEGANVHHLPVMETVPIDQSSDAGFINNCILNYSSYRRAIFVSRSSVYSLFDWLKKNVEKYPEGLPLGPLHYAIGKTTADTLKNININAEYPKQDFSSEGLLGLPSLLVGDHQKVVIFSGVGGRQLLSHELKSRGFLVDNCELYNRKYLKDFSNEINRLISEDILDVIVVHSGELLENLLSQVTLTNLSTLKLLPLLVPSERIRLLAQSLGFEKIIRSPSASTEQMVSILRECYSNRL